MAEKKIIIVIKKLYIWQESKDEKENKVLKMLERATLTEITFEVEEIEFFYFLFLRVWNCFFKYPMLRTNCLLCWKKNNSCKKN